MNATLMFLGLISVVAADNQWQVLEPREGQPAASNMLYAYLAAHAHAALDRRQDAYEKLKTPEDCDAYQKRLRETFVKQLGGFPDRTPLNAQVVGELTGDGYRVEKIIYESRPHHHVTAALYLPNAKPPYPAVLIACGHSKNGKAAGYNQRMGILLAKNGLAAMCYDPIGQGERSQSLPPDGAETLGSTTEHFLIGVGSILLGTNTARYRIWDGMRGIDYLTSRDDVDPQRIGFTGCSGGGTLTSYIMALDDRVACAAPACYLTTFRRLIDTLGPQDSEQNIFGQIALGIDHPDYILMRAPKPTLICATTEDFFDIGGTWDCFRQAKRVYTRYGFAERVDLVEADGKHGVMKVSREGMTRWMRRWLLEIDDAIVEEEPKLWTDEQLQCTPRGEVLLLDGERSVYDINIDLATKYAGERDAHWKTAQLAAARDTIRDLAAVRPLAKIPVAKVELLGKISQDNFQAQKFVLEPEPGISLAAISFAPKEITGDTYLYLDGRGLRQAAESGEASPSPIQRLVDQGHEVIAVDLRGLGETRGASAGEQLGDWKNFYMSYLLGRSLVGMRTEDVLACAKHHGAGDSNRSKPRPLHVIATDECCLPALHAAALEPDLFASVKLVRMVQSWDQVVRSKDQTQGQFENAIHGALKFYDLPNLVSLAGKDRVTIVSGESAEDQSRTTPSRGYTIPTIDLADQKQRQVIVDREPGQYLGHPTTVLLEDGRTMLCVYPKGHGRGAIVYKRSSDGGKTWSDRLPTPESWATSREVPTLHRVVDADGKKRIIMFSGLYPVRMAVTEDDGVTWSEIKPVGDWGGIVAMGCVEQLKSGPGHYLAMFHDDGRFFTATPNQKNPVVFTLYKTFSKDGGLSWSPPAAIFARSDVHLCEPGIIRSPDGKQLAVLLRENSRRRNSYVIFSDDEGATWSDPRELPAALTGDRHTGRYAPDGRLFISFRDTTLDSPTKGDWVAWVGKYDDIVKGSEGQYRVRIMDNTKGADCAYPAVDLLPDGTFVTTTYGHWTKDQQPYIVSVRLKLAELDAMSDAGR